MQTCLIKKAAWIYFITTLFFSVLVVFFSLLNARWRQRQSVFLVFPHDYHLKATKGAMGDKTQRDTQLIPLKELPCGNERKGDPVGEMADMKELATAGNAF